MSVPEVFHRIWVGGDEPGWMRPFKETWTEHHPGWTLLQWGDENVGDLFPLVNQELWDHAEVIAPNHVGQLRADVLRYELLHRFGGVYVDADFRCLKSLEPLIRQRRTGLNLFATYEEQGRWIANGLMGAEAGHEFIAHLIDGLKASVEHNIGSRPARMTGPQYLTRMWHHYSPDGVVLNQRHFYPYSYRDVASHPVDEEITDPEVYAVHVWANRRRERGLVVGGGA